MYVTVQQFESYYKFATVRNPYSRAVSLFNYMQPTASPKTARSFLGSPLRQRTAFSFNTFWDDVIEPAFNDARQKTFGTLDYYSGDYWFVRPQSEFIYDHKERLVADVLRLETLSESWPAIAEKFGLVATLPSVNPSKRIMTLEDLTGAQRRKIRERYASDFALLGYEL